MYLRQAGLTRNPTFRIFIPFGVGDKARLRKPRSNANTHVAGNAPGQTDFQSKKGQKVGFFLKIRPQSDVKKT
jgi:hypothetical protein